MLGYGAGKNGNFAESLRLPKLGQPLLRQLQGCNKRPGYGATNAQCWVGRILAKRRKETEQLSSVRKTLKHCKQPEASLAWCPEGKAGRYIDIWLPVIRFLQNAEARLEQTGQVGRHDWPHLGVAVTAFEHVAAKLGLRFQPCGN